MALQNAIGFFESLGVQPIAYNDYFLPSKDALDAMHTELHLYGKGGFTLGTFYQTSSEVNYYLEHTFMFSNGTFYNNAKSNTYLIRPCRAFTSITNYNLRDIGPAGGLIFWKSGNDYLEAAPSDISGLHAWSNITNVEIGTTDTTIGTGQANTTAIINQAGHTDSAAKLCDDLVI